MSKETGLGPEAFGAIDESELDARRAMLRTEQGQLAAQLGELHVGDPAEAHDENFADSGQVAAEQGESMVLATKLREQLDDVQKALDKLDRGSYGVCEVCGESIGDARLEAMPAARFCIAHAG